MKTKLTLRFFEIVKRKGSVYSKQQGEHTGSSEVLEEAEILSSLGLTLSEAKVFLSLCELEASTAGKISKNSGVAREFVYQVLLKLLKRGLVEVLLTSPKKYRAIPIEEAYAILFERKEEENRKLHAEASKALEKHQKETKHEVAVDSHTCMVPSTTAPDARINHAYLKTEKSIDLVFPVGKFLQWSRYYAELTLEEIIKRNVKMRIITQERLLKILATHPELFSDSFKSKLKYVNFKYVQKPFSVEMMIFDKETLFFSTTTESNINKMIWLRTDNPLILEMANGYFESMWKEATSD